MANYYEGWCVQIKIPKFKLMVQTHVLQYQVIIMYLGQQVLNSSLQIMLQYDANNAP